MSVRPRVGDTCLDRRHFRCPRRLDSDALMGHGRLAACQKLRKNVALLGLCGAREYSFEQRLREPAVLGAQSLLSRQSLAQATHAGAPGHCEPAAPARASKSPAARRALERAPLVPD